VKIAAASAPRYLRRTAAEFPAHSGYLRADPQKVEKWRGRLAALGQGRKIGLSWRGGVARTGRSWRSLAPAQLLPLFSQADGHFVSLQYGDADAEIAQLEKSHGVHVHHWADALADYDETAALVGALDLTISVCTAVVHLAGALGRPVWVMAPVKADARYGLTGPSMRWYPSARMFRQPVFGDWHSVVDEVRRELARLAAPAGSAC
jgi:ADP-heptose:LPS heptosyltransferase